LTSTSPHHTLRLRSHLRHTCDGTALPPPPDPRGCLSRSSRRRRIVLGEAS
jgi:hypothetical protein